MLYSSLQERCLVVVMEFGVLKLLKVTLISLFLDFSEVLEEFHLSRHENVVNF